MNIPTGWSKNRPHLVGFVHEEDPFAFGFLDPAQVILSIHIIPAFAFGSMRELLHGR